MVSGGKSWYDPLNERRALRGRADLSMKHRNTAELYYRHQLVAYCVLGAVWLVLGLAFLLPLPKEGGTAALIFLLIIFIPIILYCLFQYIRYRNMRFSEVQEVRLAQTASSVFTRCVGFVIEVDTGGVKRSVETKHVFLPTSLFASLSLDEYSGQDKAVGYSESSGEWIVLA